MKIKVTVELDEGVKKTREVTFTAESVILNVSRNGTSQLKNVMVEDAARQASDAARQAMEVLYDIIAGNGLLAHGRTNPVIGGETELYVGAPIKDVDHIPKDARDEVTQNVMNWLEKQKEEENGPTENTD